MSLFSRANPRSEWDATLASELLQQRFGRPWLRDDLLQALVVIQHHFGTVATVAQQWLATQCGIDRAEIRALIHFYHFLTEDEALPLRIRFSSNIIEHMQGMPALLNQLRFASSNQTRIEQTACIGQSDQGPAALINGFPLTHLTPQRIDAIAERIHQYTPLQEWPDDWFKVTSQIHHAGPILNFRPDPGSFLQHAHALAPQAIFETITRSGLRGRGGAGFPTGIKWQHCAETAAPKRYVVCNADEGEPGTFKDRVMMQENLDALLCGMALCAHAIGASKGIIYLRGEYLFLFHPLQQRIHAWRKQGWLNAAFDIEIHLGAGAYICGEETALLESVEGRRGIPRIKPPFPINRGLFQMPTVVNNVETFIAAAWVALNGADAFRSQGTQESAGSHVHSVSGDCAKPGIYELPFGCSVNELLEKCGAPNATLVQLGGPSGTLVDATEFHKPLAYESVSPGGSIMVFDQSRSSLAIARNFTAFFQHESCGFCSPCRAGCQVLLRDLNQPDAQLNPPALKELAQLINTTSHCGLGQTAGRPVLNWLQREPS